MTRDRASGHELDHEKMLHFYGIILNEADRFEYLRTMHIEVE